MMPLVAPNARILTFSSSVDLRLKSAENPMARIAIGIAASSPCPNFSVKYETEGEDAECNMWIIMAPYVEGGSGSTGGEEGGSTGDTKVEDKDTKKKDEEKKPEEPKESEEQIFNRELLESAAAAKAGDNVTIDATLWHSFSSDVLKELLSKEGVSYTLYYNYEGECFYITLPAGAVLEEGCEWYGPLKLNAMFGRTMIDKKDLHAAIDG